MSRNLEIDFLDEDPTDELPALSEEALLDYPALASEPEPSEPAAAAPESANPVKQAATPSEPAPQPAQPAAVGRELQADLVRLFDRIGEFETLLAEQAKTLDQQRAELNQQKAATDHWQREAARLEARCSELESVADAAKASSSDSAASSPTVADQIAEPVASDLHARELQRQREELETLSHYIDARNERIRGLELELAARETRIAELTAEIEQRTEREHAATGRAQTSVAHAEAATRRLAETLALLAERELQLREARLGNGAVSASTEIAAPAEAPVEQSSTLQTHADTDTAKPVRDSKLFMAWPPAPGHSSLVCMTSDDPTTYELEPSTTITIGRGENCEVQIPTHYVSREHARLVVGQKNVTVEDLSSRNGVFVNDVRVQTQELKHGDLLTIGETQFRFVGGGSA